MSGQTFRDQASASGAMAAPVEVQASPATWFDAIYRQAHGDMAAIPWVDGRANPMMVAWLNACSAGLIRPGSRVAVVGCGLGDDVAELACRGYDVLGFDVAPTAVEWARTRFPELSSCFQAADVLGVPTCLQRRFDVVVENYTIQSLPPPMREAAAAGIASLARQRGMVLAICRGRDEGELLEHVQGPPWPLTVSELTGLFEAHGLRPLQPVDDFEDDERPPVRRLRAVFAR